MITTVLGEISENDLGVTSSHEHIFIDMRKCVDVTGDEADCFYDKISVGNRMEVFADPYGILDNALLDDVDFAVEEVNYFKKWGGQTIVDCTLDEIGRNPVRILPIGAYKNTDITKISAPKLGYRFSYDFKVTGSYYTSTGQVRTDKKVNIQTKFYYISKDGKTFIQESSGGEGIYLFYKNSQGKYVRIDNNGGNYELKYTPQDGYRYIEDDTTSTLATTSVSLGNLRNMTIKHNMATPTNNRAAITYYGEYKLPNSTIAVKVDSSGKYNINNPLTDGYIGVVFDISATAGKVTQNGVQIPVVLKYNKNTKSTDNTSQWDYEGFLGFTNYGNKVKTGEVSLKLEKGTWQISNDTYNKIKGTVILYDMDQRAATDYE